MFKSNNLNSTQEIIQKRRGRSAEYMLQTENGEGNQKRIEDLAEWTTFRRLGSLRNQG